LIDALFLTSPPKQADINGDGAATSAELPALIRQFGAK